MKKIFALILAIAMLLTSVAAIAEEVVEAEAVEAEAVEAETVEASKPTGTPNINTFATMKVKYVGGKFNASNSHVGADNYYKITLSKPVDRLLVKWAEQGAEPEELAVDENLEATALTWGHKYMPGTEQGYVTSYNGKTLNNKNTLTYTAEVLGYDVENSETVYKTGKQYSPYYSDGSNTVAFKYEINFPKVVLDPKAPISIADQMATYAATYPMANGYDWVLPVKYVDKDGNVKWTEGYIQGNGYSFNGIDPKSISTVKATPDQAAFLTVQGDWAVYYNRSGHIVGIELYDGQF